MENAQQTIPFALRDVYVIEKHFTYLDFEDLKVKPDESYNVNITQNSGHNFVKDDNLVRINLHVELIGSEVLDENTQKPKFKIKIGTQTVFEIPELETVLTKATDSSQNEVLISMASIAYSTLRGIYVDLSGRTPFRDVMLPLIDPSTLVSTIVDAPPEHQ